MSDSLSASAMTEILGAVPKDFFEKGDLISAKSPKPSYRKSAMWQWASEIGEAKPLNDHLMEVSRFLEDREDKLLSLVGCDIDVFCGVFSDGEQIGFDIDHEVVKALANYPVHLVFDAYGNHAD